MIQSRLSEEPGWVAMTSPVADVDPLGAYASLPRATLFWEKPLAGESVAGFGAAALGEVPWNGNPWQVLDALSASGQITWMGDGKNQRPPGPWFGGFAFAPGRIATPLWRGFKAAKWILPELLIWRRGSHSFATSFCAAASGLKEAERGIQFDLAAVRKLPSARVGRHPVEHALTMSSDRLGWERLVERALRAIEAGSLSKVVLARRIAADSEVPLRPPDILSRLRQTVPECTLFSLHGADGATFLGATPETLCRVSGYRLETEAIAGSAPKPGEPPLRASDKEAREHRAVVDGIEGALRPLCAELRVDAAPGVMGLPYLRHLRTAVRGRLRGGVVLSELVSALHPTPAVGGVPRDRALRFLAEHEDLDRGWYAGPIGWVGEGAAELAVAIRSALIRGREANLFVGAGVVAGSTAEGEWQETHAKSLSLLEAIGGRHGRR